MQDNGNTPETQCLKAYDNPKFMSGQNARSIRILSEYYEPEERFEEHKVQDTIVFFGSARFVSMEDALIEYERVKAIDPKTEKGFRDKLRQAQRAVEMAKYYEDAVVLSKMLTEWSMQFPVEARYTICTGGGPGIMEAANKGATLAGGLSVGLNISIPFEQFVNKYVTPELKFEFHYFFMRKFWFAYLAKALVVFPGGFGTMDELFEMLTLIQTEKIKRPLLIIGYDEKYWKSIINFDALVDYGTISRGDIDLFHFCNTPKEAFDTITNYFKTHNFKKKNNK
jgi:uncharacterized protein (TIGR00730 family)